MSVETVSEILPLHPIRARRLPFEILPLAAGDHLTRSEFERRYEAMPRVKKAELLEGVVYMPSPVRFVEHGELQVFFTTWIGVYRANTPGTRAGDNATVRLDPDNEPQPDVLLLLESEKGGFSEIDEDGYIAGPPELVVEIAASTASYDLHEKFKVYRRNGVQEYIVWRVYDGAIDWFKLEKETYVQLAPDAAGILRSQNFPGLWLDVAAMLSGDLAQVLATLQQGIATPEHKAFVERLASQQPS